MKRPLSHVFKERSKKFLTTVLDLSLFLIASPIMLSVASRNPHSIYQALECASELNYESLKRAWKRAREKGWIKGDLTLTKEGQARLGALLPQPRSYPRRFNGTWYLASFDIPQEKNQQRAALRGALKRLGFGKLHESLWLSPYNFLGDVARYLKQENLTRFVILATSKEIGTERAKILARRVWNLDALEMRYIEFLGKAAREGDSDPFLWCHYFAIVKDDPFLPLPLLGEHWRGLEAHALYRQIWRNTPLLEIIEKTKNQEE